MHAARISSVVLQSMTRKRIQGAEPIARQTKKLALITSSKVHVSGTGTPSVPSHVVLAYDRLLPATLSARYKRFLGDVTMEGDKTATVIHVPNTGPMTGLVEHLPSPVLLSKSTNSKRKYAHTLEWVQPHAEAAWVGVHSAKANAMVAKLLALRAIPELLPYAEVKAEVRFGSEKSRVDFVLEQAQSGDSAGGSAGVAGLADAAAARQCYVEVKSVTLAEDTSDGERIALFPDTVSIRGQRHIRELLAVVKSGGSAALVFLVQRGDVQAFAPCHAKDPEYGRLLVEAAAAGVKLVALACQLDVAAQVVRSRGTVPVRLNYKLEGV